MARILEPVPFKKMSSRKLWLAPERRGQMTLNGMKVDSLARVSGLHLARNWQIAENGWTGFKLQGLRAEKGFIWIAKYSSLFTSVKINKSF